jgi:hypothetical protein
MILYIYIQTGLLFEGRWITAQGGFYDITVKRKEKNLKAERSDLIIFKCPNCHNDLKVKEESRGKKGLCPKCRFIIRIPDEIG